MMRDAEQPGGLRQEQFAAAGTPPEGMCAKTGETGNLPSGRELQRAEFALGKGSRLTDRQGSPHR